MIAGVMKNATNIFQLLLVIVSERNARMVRIVNILKIMVSKIDYIKIEC